MSDTTPVSGVAQRYATALFELAEESGALEAVERHLDALSGALDASADLRDVVASPIHTREEQGAAMAAVCDAIGVGAPTKNLVGLMASKRRLHAVGDVVAAFRALLAKKRGVVSAEVVAATPLSDAQRAELERVLKNSAGAQVALDVKIDPSLIGGLVVRLGSTMIDTSIRSRLTRLQTSMKEVGV